MMEKICPNCGEEMIRDRYKDILELNSRYFTVDLLACSECGYVDDDESAIY